MRKVREVHGTHGQVGRHASSVAVSFPDEVSNLAEAVITASPPNIQIQLPQQPGPPAITAALPLVRTASSNQLCPYIAV